ncbi:MAG: hypothetical protein IT427_11105 [Pirellulales bacterium]|nr:hypothetical protein [Pirellulales bacterium]
MVSLHDVLRHLNAKPFKPFHIHMVSGKEYGIRHPERVQATGRLLVIFTCWSVTDGIFDH